MGTSRDRAFAALTGAATGVAVTSLVWQSAVLELAFAAVLCSIAIGVTLLLPEPDRAPMWRIALLAITLRAGVGAFLRFASLETGRDGFISGDDRQYFDLAADFVAYLQGTTRGSEPPYWGGAEYLFGAWTYLVSGLIAVFGERPLVPVLTNALLGTLMVVTCWDLGRLLFGRKPAYLAALILMAHPSLVLWASTNLKDTFALLIIAVVLWSIVRLTERPRPGPLVIIGLALVTMQSVRTYIFVGLSIVLPVAMAFAPRLSRPRRIGWTAAAATLSIALLVLNQVGVSLAPALLANSTRFREGMAAGARTGFQEAPPVRVEVGTTFVVPTPTPGAGATPAPAPSVVVVPQGARIVVVPAGSPLPADSLGSVHVRPGDLVVVGPPGSTAAPPDQRPPLPGTGDPVQLAPQVASEDDLTRQTLAYLPKGMVYALFAPWPWLSDRSLDLLTLPEMLVWYAAILLLPFSLHRERRRWQSFLGPLLFVGGTLLIFALVQGNWGTLFRHRAMVIPFVLVLAAPGAIALIDQLRRSRQRRPIAPSAGHEIANA